MCQDSISGVKLQMELNDNLVQEKLDNILKLLGDHQFTKSPISQHFSRQTYISTPSRQRRLIEYAEFSSPPDSHSSSMEQYSFEQYNLDDFGQLLPTPEEQISSLQHCPVQQQQLPVRSQQLPHFPKALTPFPVTIQHNSTPHQLALPPPQPNKEVTTMQHSSTPHQLAPQQPKKDIPITSLSAAFLASIKAKSSSRANFAANLARHMFTEEVRAGSNVGGKCGKDQLDPAIIGKIKTAAFQMYPLAGNEIEIVEWKKCHIAIDECGRRLNRKRL